MVAATRRILLPSFPRLLYCAVLYCVVLECHLFWAEV